MDTALLYSENGDPIIVSAADVKNGKYNRKEEFVDPKYEFKVIFVKAAKNNGCPHFRFYYSYEDYKKLYPERASRYEIVANMRRYEESQWHRKWKDALSSFCIVEKCIKNPDTGKWKFADAFIEDYKTCIEFQNSYISFDFEERNKFYSDLGINTIWLYNLPDANVRSLDNGSLEILENNSKGFFRISEIPENLKSYKVFIQVKNGTIYRINELHRRQISGELKSTIRYFDPVEIYSEKDFIEAVKNNNFSSLSERIHQVESRVIPKSLPELWKHSFIWMVVRDTENNDEIFINRDKSGNMFRDLITKHIRFKYVDNKFKSDYLTSLSQKKEYQLSEYRERKKVWVLINCRYDIHQ